jgi:hypothetical protein
MQRVSWAVFTALFSVALAALQVELDYATYLGYYDSTYNLNNWKRSADSTIYSRLRIKCELGY